MLGRGLRDRRFCLAIGSKADRQALTLTDRYAEGLRSYRQRAWQKAEDAFRVALGAVPDDALSESFLAVCLKHASNLFPTDWDGVWELREK